MQGTWIFLAVLFLVTMGVALAVSAYSKRKTEERLEDPNAPTSALAKDGPGPNPVQRLEDRDLAPGARANKS